MTSATLTQNEQVQWPGGAQLNPCRPTDPGFNAILADDTHECATICTVNDNLCTDLGRTAIREEDCKFNAMNGHKYHCSANTGWGGIDSAGHHFGDVANYDCQPLPNTQAALTTMQRRYLDRECRIEDTDKQTVEDTDCKTFGRGEMQRTPGTEGQTASTDPYIFTEILNWGRYTTFPRTAAVLPVSYTKLCRPLSTHELQNLSARIRRHQHRARAVAAIQQQPPIPPVQL